MAYKSKSKLIEIQRRIGAKVLETLKPLEIEPKVLAGVDAAYSRRYGGVAVAVAVDLRGKLLGYGVAIGEPPLEYIPGLLAFREAPLFYAALQRLKINYDVLVVDGHGLSHPRHAGIASHMGLALGKPTIGVAKKKLYGNIEELEKPVTLKNNITLGGYVTEKGERSLKLAAIISIATGRKLYVSPGAYITLDDAVKIVVDMLEDKLNLPAPTYHADKLSKSLARQLDKGLITPEDVRQGRLQRTLDTYIHKS
jgi:deoxyribonuclease V